MSSHPDKAALIDVLLQVGRRAAMESTSEHPEDVADQISMAVEAAGIALNIAHRRGLR